MVMMIVLMLYGGMIVLEVLPQHKKWCGREKGIYWAMTLLGLCTLTLVNMGVPLPRISDGITAMVSAVKGWFS